MKKLGLTLGSITVSLIAIAPARAALIGVRGEGEIILAPDRVLNRGIYNDDVILGFDERQNVLLSVNIQTDSGIISRGTVVSSHLIFFNQDPQSNDRLSARATWRFDRRILGVLSDRDGALEAASTPYLGALRTLYPTSAGNNVGALPTDLTATFSGFDNRGLERGNSYTIDGSSLLTDFSLTQPGDWIRVITVGIPEPLTILGTSTAIGFGAFFKRKMAKK